MMDQFPPPAILLTETAFVILLATVMKTAALISNPSAQMKTVCCCMLVYRYPNFDLPSSLEDKFCDVTYMWFACVTYQVIMTLSAKLATCSVFPLALHWIVVSEVYLTASRKTVHKVHNLARHL